MNRDFYREFYERELAEIAALEANWDSYDALATTTLAVDIARQVLQSVPHHASIFVPLTDGGLMITWQEADPQNPRDDLELELVIHGDGHLEGLVTVNRPEITDLPSIPPERAASIVTGLLGGTLRAADAARLE